MSVRREGISQLISEGGRPDRQRGLVEPRRQVLVRVSDWLGKGIGGAESRRRFGAAMMAGRSACSGGDRLPQASLAGASH
jgi:hypothetical protein